MTQNDGLNSIQYKVCQTEVNQMFTRFYIDLGNLYCLYFFKFVLQKDVQIIVTTTRNLTGLKQLCFDKNVLASKFFRSEQLCCDMYVFASNLIRSKQLCCKIHVFASNLIKSKQLCCDMDVFVNFITIL